MPYSFVWLYLIKCVVHTQSYVDQRQKDFWVILVIFGKCFLLKIFKKSKNFTTLFLATHLWIMLVARPQLRAYSKALATPWRMSPPIAKNTYKILQNFWVLVIFTTQFHDLIASGSSSRELTQKLSRLSHGWISQSRKRLRQSFQNFVQGILVTRFGDLLVGQLSKKSHVLHK